jgi:hypothetical protein
MTALISDSNGSFPIRGKWKKRSKDCKVGDVYIELQSPDRSTAGVVAYWLTDPL